MSYETLTLRREDHVVVINLISLGNDQLKMARLSDDLSDLCAKVTSDSETRVIILTGDGENAFSMGTDLLGGISSAKEELQRKMCSIAEPIARFDRPVIAAINGNALGQGLELILACDIRIAVDTARFGLPHITTGLIPWDGGTQRLSRLVGRGKAMEMILTGEVIDAHEAYRISLVNRVIKPDELMGVAMDVARGMASRGPIALRYAKEAIYKGMDQTLEQGLRLEADLYFLLQITSDRTEGVTAFREKKTPRFEGR
ncbi:MAG: 3-hydroxybutyryl-CoA dehydratase [bacterium]|nr:MAG: 3-hydroxybutyryl-CoA dehydratase [bacterium]